MTNPLKSPVFYLGLCATFIAIGSAIHSKFGVFEVLPVAVSTYISFVALIFGCVGIIFVVASFVGVMNSLDYLRILKIKIGELLLESGGSSIQYSTFSATLHDVKPIFDLCLETIGVGISRQKKMKAWLRHNDSLFYKLVPLDDDAQERSKNIHAYFCLIPLNKNAVECLENHELDGASFTTDHICKSSGKAYAWYIGGIAGKNGYAKTSAVRSIFTKIKEIMNDEPKYFYTRPVSNDGLKWVKRLGFEALDKDELIQKEELCKILINPKDINHLSFKIAFQKARD